MNERPKQFRLDRFHRLYYSAPGGYRVAEDTNINGHPVSGDHGPGPYEAARTFPNQDRRFVRDHEVWKRRRFSFHQNGRLKRAA